MEQGKDEIINKGTIKRKIVFKPFPKQKEIINDALKTNVLAVLGGWGSAKTTIGAFLTLKKITEHPYHSLYGQSNPLIVIVAPTSQILKQATIPALLRLCPEELILEANKNQNEYLFANGCRVKGYSAQSKSLEGINPAYVWVDEAHLINDYIIQNLFSRYRRDRIAGNLGRQKGIIFTGVPLQGGMMEQNFREQKEGRKTFHLSLQDNPFIDEEQKRQLFMSCPAEMKDVYIYGKWGATPDAIFPSFSIIRNIKENLYNSAVDIHLGVDLGKNYSCVIFGQVHSVEIRGKKDKIVNVVDEWLFEGGDQVLVENIIKKLKESKFHSFIKSISIDPTTNPSLIQMFRVAFPGARIIQTQQGTRDNFEEYGLQAINRALFDAEGEVRLFIDKRLQEHQKGLINCLKNYRRNEKTGRPIHFDSRGDHASDALRYLVSHLLPLEGLVERTIQTKTLWER